MLAATSSLPCGSRGGLGWGCLGFSEQTNIATMLAEVCGDLRSSRLAALAPHPSPPLHAGEGTYPRKFGDTRFSWCHWC